MNDLIVLENINAVEVFNGEGLDPLLEKITKEATSVVPDVKTAKGRKTIASMAAKVAKSKTYLDGAGKDLVSGWKTQAKAVDSERKKMRDYLDNLKAEVRQPLTEWEEVEQGRINTHETNLFSITSVGNDAVNNWMEANLSKMLAYVESFSIESFEEFVSEAAIAKEEAIKQIKEAIEKRKKYDAEQAELEQMRKEKAEREQKDREEQLRKEGEERAKLEAEREKERETIASMERVANIEKQRQAAVQAKEDAERKAKEAAEQAANDVEAAAQKERDRIEAERVAEELAAKKREADTKHKAKINNAAVDALVLAGVSAAAAKKAVVAIAKGKVPYVKISY